MLCSLSRLSDYDLKEINQLETDLQKPVLAYSCHDIRPAQLSGEEIKKIQELEKRLGLSLVAVESRA